jgi:hypothetical protein
LVLALPPVGWNCYAAVARSPEPLSQKQGTPRAGEVGVWVGEAIGSASLPLIPPVAEYVNNYRQNWSQHVKRMDIAGIQKRIFRCAPNMTTTARKTDGNMVGDRNRPLGLIL